jgi:transcription elongation GreA/GreB family factor
MSKAAGSGRPTRDSHITIGSRLIVLDSYGQTELVIVPTAADVVDPLHHVPLHAPLAQALLDHLVGDQVNVRLLTGTQVLRIVAVY